MTRYLTNPLLLFVAVWTTAGAAYLWGVTSGVFPHVEPIAAAAVLLNVSAFSLGYLTWTLLRRAMPPSTAAPLLSSQPLRIDKLARSLRFTLFMGLLALLLGLYRVAVIASHSGSTFFELITDPGLLRIQLVMYIDASLSRISIIPILISLTGSFFAIGFVLLGVYLYLERSLVKYAYLAGFLLVTLTIGLTNLSRYEVTVNILYLVLAYGLMCASSGSKSPRAAVVDLLLPLASVVLLFAAVDLLLGKSSAYGHADRLHGALFSFYWYLASPLAAFNEFVATFDGPHHLGQTMFHPFYKWLQRFALVPSADFSFYGDKTFLPFMTNVYTYLRNVYEDFGMLGVAIVPYVLGWATCFTRPKAYRHFHYLNLHVILLVLILFSFYNYALMSNQVYMQAAFAFLFFRFDLSPVRTP
jgi:oligosaccharide repeat unit polymerase